MSRRLVLAALCAAFAVLAVAAGPAAALPPTLVAVACFRGVRGPVGEFFDLALWWDWLASLDRSFLFLLILPFVVAVVGLWAEHRK